MMMALEGNNGKVVLLPSRVIIIPYGYQYTDVATRGNGHARRTRESSAQRTTNGDATNYFFSTLTKEGFTRRNLVNIQSLIRQQGRGESRFLSTTYKLNEQQKFGQGLHRLHVGTGVVQCVTSPPNSAYIYRTDPKQPTELTLLLCGPSLRSLFYVVVQLILLKNKQKKTCLSHLIF